MEVTDLSDNDLIAAYRELRARRDAAKAEFTESQKPTLELMKTLEGEALKRMQNNETTSFKGDAGTAYKSVTNSFTVKDRDAFLGHVRRHDLWDLIDVRAAKAECEAYFSENNELPPGVNGSQRVAANFNAPRNK